MAHSGGDIFREGDLDNIEDFDDQPSPQGGGDEDYFYDGDSPMGNPELMTEEDLKEINPLAVAELKNHTNPYDKEKEKIKSLQIQFNKLWAQQETLGITYHSILLQIQTIGKKVEVAMNTQKEAQELIERIKGERNAEDLTDVDFNEIVRRVIDKIQNNGMMSQNSSASIEKNKSFISLSKNTLQYLFLFIVVGIVATGFIWLVYTKLLRDNTSETSLSQASMTEVVKVVKGTKITCKNKKEPLVMTNDRLVEGYTRGDTFFFKIENSIDCWFTITK